MPLSARSWPVSLPWNCCVENQLFCSAVVVVTAGPAQRCQVEPVLSARSDQATTCSPPSVRRVRRTDWPSHVERRNGRALPAATARSCSHCAIDGLQAHRLGEAGLVRLARAGDAVDALPGHQRHDRHHDQGHQHLDQSEAAARDGSCRIASARRRSRAAGSARPRRQGPARRRGGNSGSASAAPRACRRRCGRARRS